MHTLESYKLKKRFDLAKYFGLLGNPTRIRILEKMVVEGNNMEHAIVNKLGVSEYTVRMNLKYLNKYKMIKRKFISKQRHYYINYETLEDFKKLFDEFYTSLNQKIIEESNKTSEEM